MTDFQAETTGNHIAVQVEVGGDLIEFGRLHGEVQFSTRRGPARLEGETDEQFLERMKESDNGVA